MASKVLLYFATLLIVVYCCTSVTIQPRRAWGARWPKWVTRVYKEPASYVIIHHSAPDSDNGCSDSDSCKQLIRDIQSVYQAMVSVSDIFFNFIVAGDGEVYEGRGFGIQNQYYRRRYNAGGIDILLIGNFEFELPSATMLNNTKELIAQAVSGGYVESNYTLVGHRQSNAASCPGTALYNEIKTWPNWRDI